MGLDNKLAHLSKAQIENLIERYYNGEKVKSLIEEYKIYTNLNQLVRLFPPTITEETCPADFFLLYQPIYNNSYIDAWV